MSQSLDAIFRPKSIAVVGASKKKGKIGREIIHNLIEGEFEGKVFPINPNADVIHSIKCYKSLLDAPDEIDLAVVVVPKEVVMDVMKECKEKGVKGVVLITAGYKETGEEGAKREEELKRFARSAGISLVGPNCMGVVNTDPDVKDEHYFCECEAASGQDALHLPERGAWAGDY